MMPSQQFGTTVPPRVGVRELRRNLTDFLQRASNGEAFLVTSHNQVIATFGPPPAETRHRRPGALRGKIRMGTDFDTLPDDVIDAMQGNA
jgi:antitoxin (DNA-binding transcriptional repressor) of toxin-antitoxin stability system